MKTACPKLGIVPGLLLVAAVSHSYAEAHVVGDLCSRIQRLLAAGVTLSS